MKLGLHKKTSAIDSGRRGFFHIIGLLYIQTTHDTEGGNDCFWKLETIKKLLKFINGLFCGKVTWLSVQLMLS